MWNKFNRALVAGMALLLAPEIFAQASAPNVNIEDLNVSYIYAAVMGSGSYKIEDRRISMLRIPFAYMQRQVTEEKAGLKWNLPVVLGYDALNYPELINQLFDDELMTLTLLPGLEYQRRLNEPWLLKPFANLGAGYDFTRNETVLMGMMGLRVLGTWVYEDHSEFRLGTSARFAAEYQIQSYNRSSFGLIESGVDYRRDMRFRIFKRAANAGIYYRVQWLLPDWNIDKNADGVNVDIGLIHEFGGSIGFKNPFKVLGFTISRVRTGFKFGDGVRGWTIGTEFPF
jgi:hypothetical protein